MSKYRKITDREVLEKYYNEQATYYKAGIWIDNISIPFMAEMLKTSKYQIRQAYKRLAKKSLMKLEKISTYSEEYDNGLYCETVPILYTKAYVLTEKARKMFENGEEYSIEELLK